MQYQWRNQNYYEVNDMNHNWTYKKLGEVATITMGQSPTSDTYNVSEGLPFFQGNADFGKEHPSVRIYCNSPIRIADSGDILISVRAPIGAINIADRKCCIGRGLAAIRGNDNYISRFIYYLLMASKEKLVSQGTGSTFKSIGKDVLYNMLIPVPPLSTQSRIVSELDLLQSLIDKQKAQLKEYDTLAQSIFYDMFGDPVENEKGWEVKEWGELFDTILGKMLDAKKQNSNDEIRRYLGNSNVQWRSFDLNNLKTMSFSIKEIEKLSLRKGDVLICEGGESGRCAVWEENNSDILFQKAIHRARVKTAIVEPHFIPFLMEILRKNNGLKNYVSQATIEHLTGEKLNKLSIILPPLSLQQSFAAKIESIEKQKAAISKSIAETEKLFEYTMDKYFG